MNRHQICIFACMALVIGTAVAGPTEEKWGGALVGPHGLKEYVVAILAVKNQPDIEAQKLKVAKPTSDLLDKLDVMPFLFVYDSLGSERDLKELAELTPYYLGEAAGVLYECLLLRKGHKILPVLKKMARSKSNECIERFGKDANICFSDAEYRAQLKSYLNKISIQTKTNTTNTLCTTTGWSSM